MDFCPKLLTLFIVHETSMKNLFSVLAFFVFTGSLFAQSQETILAIQQSEIKKLRDTIQLMSTQLQALDSKAASLQQSANQQNGDLNTLKANRNNHSGALVIDSLTAIDANSGWHRSYGDTGWYNGTYGGGWHMSDSSWIRSYGSKNVYTDQVMRADNGFQVDGISVIDGDGRIPQLDSMKTVTLYQCPCTGQISTASFCFQGSVKFCSVVGSFLSR